MLVKATLILLPLLAGVHAKNDWSVPCTTGSCSYDLPETNNSLASGSLKIWGNQDAITDITNAADWEILDCNSTLSEQDIRLVCKNDADDPNSGSLCNHLYTTGDAVDKIVRLPESCGKSAFARIAKSWVPADQSIPADVAKRIVRRAGVPAQVKALRLDTNWEGANWSKNGQVNIAIQAGNYQGVPTEINVSGSKARRFTLRKAPAPRGFLDGLKKAAEGAVNDVKNGAEKAASAVEGVATQAAGAVKNVATAAAGDVKNAATHAASAIESVATVAATDIKKAATVVASEAKDIGTKIATAAKDAASDVAKVANKTIGVDKSFSHQITFDKENINLINSAIQCFGQSLTLNVDVSANANVAATLDIVAKGTLIPPKFSDFGVVGIMNGPVGGTIDMQADVSGFMDSGFIELFSVGIPGLDFPDILEVGPTFTVNAEISGQVDVTMDMKVGVNMELQNATIAFPPNAKNAPANSSFHLGDAPMTMNAAGDVQFQGSITASLRPSLNLGISALKGKIQGQVFLAMDASAVATLDLSGSAAIEKDKNGGSAGAVPTDPSATDDGSANATAIDNGSAANSTVVDDGSASNSTDTTDDTTTDASDDGTADAIDNSADDGSNATATDDGSDDTTDDQADVVDDSADDQEDDSTDADATDDTDAAQQVVQQRQAANDTTDPDTTDDQDATDDTTDPTSDGTDDPTDAATVSDDASADANATTTDATSSDGTDATATTTATSTTTTDAKGDTTTKTAPSIGGCVNVGANINVNVGADGDFLSLFQNAQQIPLFTKNFNIFTKCFGTQKGQEAQFASSQAVNTGFSQLSVLGQAVPLRRSETSLERRIDLSCPIGQLTKFPINSGIVTSNLITSTSSQLLI